MNPKEFISEVVKLYHAARETKYLVEQRIIRGRVRTISADIEDLFAKYLIINNQSIDTILVDKPLSVKRRKSNFYPDITVIKSNTIVAFFDLKMDLGWMRDKLEVLNKKHAELVDRIRGRDGVTQLYRGDSTKSKYLIADSVTYDTVIVSGRNINPDLLKDQSEKAKQYADRAGVFVLSDGEHPNSPQGGPQEVISRITINYSEFEDLSTRIKTTI